MKKISLFTSLLVVLSALTPAFAYTSTDVDNATFLANENLIVKQSSSSGFRLDDTITRAEVVGTALKFRLPENYKCKNYFSDVKNNDWICRAVEIGADH